jgi:hypothetical protein
MRTSLNEIKLVDDYLLKKAAPGDALLFDAMLILNPELAAMVIWQQNTHAAIKQYSRKKLRAEIDAVHVKLFNEARYSSFRQKILNFFKHSG